MKEARKALRQAKLQYERTGAVDEAEADMFKVENNIANVIERMVDPVSFTSHISQAGWD